MNLVFLVLLLVINVGIAYWNARTIAPVWGERHKMGWGLWAVTWSAVIQSAVGFSMPVLLLELFGAFGLGLLPAAGIKAAASLWYLLVIIPVLGTGLTLTVHSWVEAWKRRDFASTATAAWNTGASASNLYSASSGIGDAFSAIGDIIPSPSDDDSGAGIVLFLVVAIAVLAVFSGALITVAVISANKHRALA